MMRLAAIWWAGVLLLVPGSVAAQDAAARSRLACDRGDAPACTVLGLMYELGEGVGRDAARAVTLYEQACDAGDPSGCVNLGLLVESGTGVTRDAARATDLYRRACERGQPLACDLGAALERGAGAPPGAFFKVGRVTDSDTGSPLPEAMVVVPGLGVRAVSDALGQVSLGRLQAGTHRIVVERFGYEPVAGEIEVPGNAEFLVMLTRGRIDDVSAPGRIVGRIDEEGTLAGLQGVEIATAGEPTLQTLSNADGRFELRNVPPGLVEVRLTMLGFATRTATVVVQPGATVELSATMSTRAIELEPIEVMVRSGYLDRGGFYQRARAGWGTQFAPEDIERIDPFSAADLIRGRVPGVQVRMGRYGLEALARRGFGFPGDCMLEVYLDGTFTDIELDDIPVQWLDAVEVYHGVGTPAQFQFANGCGVILIWTRR